MKRRFLLILITIISVFCLAFGLIACSTKNDGKGHTHSYGEWMASGMNMHFRECSCGKYETQNHTFNGDVCSICGYTIKNDWQESHTKHRYVQQMIDNKYLKSKATCTEPAVYYYACSCGEKGEETFTYGLGNGHSYTQQNTSATYLRSEATCIEQATYYYSCACGAKGTDFFASGSTGTIHTSVEQKAKEPETCGSVGYAAGVYCKDCETYISGHELIPATGKHSYADELTCHDRTCLICRHVETASTTHSYTEGVCNCGELRTNGLYFSHDNGEYSVAIGTCKDTEIYIPARYNGDPVVGIKDRGFYYSGITKVVLPSTITYIGDSAFERCRELSEIDFPAGLTSIGELAFGYCEKLAGVTLPIGLTSLGSQAFRDCEAITAISVPAGVTGMERAFFKCTKLADVTLQGGLLTIGDSAFSSCEALEQITVPNSVTKIGNGAFSSCTKLADVTLQVGLLTIGNGAFSSCAALEQITVPNSVTSIGNGAFYSCTKLADVTLQGGLLTIGDSAFERCAALEQITVPNSVTSIGNGAFYNCTALEQILLSNGLRSIGNDAFRSCTALTSITVPATISFLGERVFYECTELTSASFECNSLFDLGKAMFYGCTKLADVTLPKRLEKIGEQAFINCNSLKTLVLPTGVSKIDKNAFTNCEIEVLTTSMAVIDSFNKEKIKTLVITGGDKVSYKSFEGCKTLTSVTIGGVTTIGSKAFTNCVNLKTVTISRTVDNIGGYAFQGCSALTDIYYDGNIGQWNDVHKGSFWDDGIGNYTVHCTNGNITK